MIRERRDDDLPALAERLMEQRPSTGYPASLPPDGPVALIRRRGEVAAWVWADDDDQPLAHISLVRVLDDHAGAEEVAQWCAALGVGHEELGVVSALFVALGARRQGVAKALMQHAADRCRAEGLRPVLDVVPCQTGALELHESLGWERIGTVRPEWLTDDLPDAVTMVLR